MDALANKLRNNQRPKKILTLDGGGIRGILTLGMLKKIETIVREKDKSLVLSDYYDLISGTSTGAIIASALAIGKSVDEIIELYKSLGDEIFDAGRKHKFFKRDWTTLRAIFNENYDSNKLEKYLKNTFGEIKIGDTENIKCGLVINCKRADTYSLWSVTNHPDGKYYVANSHLKLWELCRASGAAPYYFKPKLLALKTRAGQRFEATFIDGGVSLANNPAWQTFLVATVPSFGYKWKSGINEIHITSLGTGNGLKKEAPAELESLRSVSWAPKLSDLFMVDALEMNQIIMDVFGYNKGEKVIVDSQFDNLDKLEYLKQEDKLFTFIRHNVMLTNEYLNKLGIELDETEIESIKQMDYSENIDLLLKIGEAYANNNIKDIL